MRLASLILILLVATVGLVTYQKAVFAHQSIVAERNAQLNSIILEVPK